MAGLYIHIPFCHSKCGYCDFFSTPRHSESVMSDFTDALIAEWRMRKDETSEPITTLYIGGGTPSILPVGQLRRLVEAIGLDGFEEFTVEANPEDVTPQWVKAVKDVGVNRVSVGLQSFNDDELKAAGRRHDARMALQSITTLRDNGIDNVSGDLIYGLPLQTAQSWQSSLETLADLEVSHISAYNLSIEPGTRFHAMLQAGKIAEATEETVEQMYQQLTETLKLRGYEHYEISNFAKPGFKARHNSRYWDFTPYIGLGPSAHSFDGVTRRINRNGVTQYIEALKTTTFFDIDSETPDQQLNDFIITAMRTSRGIIKHEFARRFGETELLSLIDRAQPFIATGHVIVTDTSIAIKESSFLISDTILLRLIR